MLRKGAVLIQYTLFAVFVITAALVAAERSIHAQLNHYNQISNTPAALVAE